MIKHLLVTRCFNVRRLLELNSHLAQIGRFFSSQDASTALRPFYFIVHPDLFGQHPAERAINEHSLQVLSEYLASYKRLGSQQQGKLDNLVFYIRPQQDNAQPGLQCVKISLSKKTLRETVVGILVACGLSSSHVPQATADLYSTDRPIKWSPSYYTATGKKNPDEVEVKKVSRTLRSWLKQNGPQSRRNEESVRHIQTVITTLQSELQSELELREIRFANAWGFQHFRGCLKSFHRLYNNHPEFVKFVLKDKVLLFSNNTGVSRRGEIVLSSADVPEKWMTLLKSVAAYEAMLHRLPVMETKLSSLLKNIQVVREERRNSSVMAEDYELLLNSILNSLRRCQRLVDSTFLTLDLSHLKLAVEGPMSPLMLSSQGHFLIPASVPGSLIVDFIYKNRFTAKHLLAESERLMFEEDQSHQRALTTLGLAELRKDDSVTSSQMTSCCQRLVELHDTLPLPLEKSRLTVSHYYSVMQDGQIILPWNWLSDDDDTW